MRTLPVIALLLTTASCSPDPGERCTRRPCPGEGVFSRAIEARFDRALKRYAPGGTIAHIAEASAPHPAWMDLAALGALVLLGFAAAVARWGLLGVYAFAGQLHRWRSRLRTFLGRWRALTDNPCLGLAVVGAMFLLIGWAALVSRMGLTGFFSWLLGGAP